MGKYVLAYVGGGAASSGLTGYSMLQADDLAVR